MINKKISGFWRRWRNKHLKKDIETPHIHDPNYPGGVRYPTEQEIPL